jgi:Rrf2 family protein
MAFSQKTVYALRATFELARRLDDSPTTVAVIAEAQAIPPRFLENILVQLKLAGVVESVRGKEGGYRLARPPEEVTVGHVLRAIEGSTEPVSCLGEKMQDNCPMRHDCVFLPMWERAHKAMLAVYDGTTYQDLLNEDLARVQRRVPAYSI